MSVVVLTRPENAVSAVRLGYPVVHDASRIPDGSVVIRWGDSQSSESRSWAAVLNKRSVLQISTDKPAALRSLSRVVSTPRMFHSGDSLPRGKRYVVRPQTHSEGSDFSILEGGERVPSESHATELIENVNEYRVWFVREKYLVAKRVPRRSEGQSETDLCRSKWGYSFRDECFPKLAEEMAKARTAIPLDFGAVDVLWKTGDGDTPGKWYFLEFNSAPSLDHDRVLGHFQTHLSRVLESVQRAVGPSETHLQPILATFQRQEVSRAVPTPENSANRQLRSEADSRTSCSQQTRPITASVIRSESDAYADAYRAKLIAEKKAMEDRIRKEVYGV